MVTRILEAIRSINLVLLEVPYRGSVIREPTQCSLPSEINRTANSSYFLSWGFGVLEE